MSKGWGWLVLGIATALAACGDDDAVCRAGEQIACACPGGGEGAQRCREDGSGFDACICGAPDAGAAADAGPRDAGIDAGEPLDAGSDAATDGGGGASVPGLLVFVDRCVGGCTFSAGSPDDSRVDRSSVLSATATLSEFERGSADFAEVVSCLESLYAPFDIAFTTSDPDTAAHTQLVVAGSPHEAGLPAGTRAVAPFTCAVVDYAVAFAFANIFDGSSNRVICEAAAQALAQTLGLDNAYHCPDVMTYVMGCGDKSFTDYDAPCGDTSARACTCGGATQNSHQALLDALGAAP